MVVRPVTDPKAKTIRVALDRVRRCPDGVPDVFWPDKLAQVQDKEDNLPQAQVDSDTPREVEGAWKGRLRPRSG